MSIFENLESSKRDIKKGLAEQNLADMIETGLSVISSGGGIQASSQSREGLSASTGWVYACVDAIANEIANINLKLYRYRGSKIEEVMDHDILRVLYRANNATTKFDLFHLTQNYLELSGEAPWLLIPNKKGKPEQIILLRPDRLTIIPGKDGELIGGYKYKVYSGRGYSEIELTPEEVIFLKYPDPKSPFRGKGTLSAVMDTFYLDEQSEEYNRNIFKNAATPSLVLSSEKKVPTQVMERLKAEIAKKYEGVSNAHKTMILEGGLKPEKMSLTNVELQFVEQQKLNRDKILAIFRVPRSILGITDDVNRANAEAGDYIFAKRTIKPKMQRLIEQLNEFFVPLFEDSNVYFLDYENPVPQNETDQLSKAEKGIQGRFITINEARGFMGLEPIENGDMLPAVDTPLIGTPAGASLNYNNERIAVAKNGRLQRKKKTIREISKSIEDEVAEKMEGVIYNSLKLKYKKSIKKKKEDPFKHSPKLFSGETDMLAFQEKQLKVSDEYEQRVFDTLGTIFGIQSRTMIDSLPNDGKVKIKDLMLDLEKQVDIYRERLSPVMGSLITEQSKIALRLIGIDPNRKGYEEKITRFSDVTRAFIARKLKNMALSVTRETNSRLRKEIQNGIEEEESIPQIAKRIRDIFDDMKDARSKVIARTEVSRATNFATVETYKDSGVVKGQQWLATLDERTDQCCASLNGKIISIDKSWFKRGDSYLGLSLNYETVKHPPLHPNCRCTIIPVLK